MATRVLRGNRVVFQNYRPAHRHGDGQIGHLELDVQPDEAAPLELREGIAVDGLDGIVYRVIRSCRAEDGWGTARHWTSRYKIAFQDVVDMCALGIMDAAVEPSSPTRRYRVRSERKLMAHLSKKYPRRKKWPR